ncbi:hypothetical protein [Nonomuraea basaltis]|uniref:hypothetical protein n=1 Tax=Nonomuraea basaltis TaxID=2495887 RepID=UPI00110C408E|nr:hypothetical protein [Nonomuraea basaltis]TMR93044.1 hypothetical protein EJK15_41505 [Nonomuraea basaltis]
MPEFHPSLVEQGRRIIEHGLDVPHGADLVPLSRDVIDGDLAAALFAHGDALEWVVFEYDADWFSLGYTALSTTEPPSTGERARLEIRFDTWGRSRTRRWSLGGRHLVHTRVLRAERIAQLRVATRTIATPHGWAIMVWRGRRAPAISVDNP